MTTIEYLSAKHMELRHVTTQRIGKVSSM